MVSTNSLLFPSIRIFAKWISSVRFQSNNSAWWCLWELIKLNLRTPRKTAATTTRETNNKKNERRRKSLSVILLKFDGNSRTNESCQFEEFHSVYSCIHTYIFIYIYSGSLCSSILFGSFVSLSLSLLLDCIENRQTMYMSCACFDPTANNLDNVCELIFPNMNKHIILAMAITHDESLKRCAHKWFAAKQIYQNRKCTSLIQQPAPGYESVRCWPKKRQRQCYHRIRCAAEQRTEK